MPPICIMDGDISHQMTRRNLQRRASQAYVFSPMYISLRQSCLGKDARDNYPGELLIMLKLSAEASGTIDLSTEDAKAVCHQKGQVQWGVAALSTMILLEALIDWL